MIPQNRQESLPPPWKQPVALHFDARGVGVAVHADARRFPVREGIGQPQRPQESDPPEAE